MGSRIPGFEYILVKYKETESVEVFPETWLSLDDYAGTLISMPKNARDLSAHVYTKMKQQGLPIPQDNIISYRVTILKRKNEFLWPTIRQQTTNLIFVFSDLGRYQGGREGLLELCNVC